MEKVTFSEFIAEIESIFANYTDSNDLDTVSIKGWVIDRLRVFGKNICDYKELIVGVENSRALLPENFKSLILALKLEGDIYKRDDEYREIPSKRYIINDILWDSLSQSYIKNNCQSQIVIENLLQRKEYFGDYMDVQPLSLVKGIQKSTLDVNCYNLHPSIRDNYPNKISITNRTINANFKKGLIYIKYNSLPSDEDGEITIPILTTGDILHYITNYVKIQIVENLIINNKNPSPGLFQLYQLWKQDDRIFKIRAQSESNWYGLEGDWAKKIYKKNRENQNRFNLPK